MKYIANLYIQNPQYLILYFNNIKCRQAHPRAQIQIQIQI